MSLEILKSKFGKGYQTDSEEKHAFALSDDRVRFDKNGAGGAVKVAGYKGIWPLFGNPKERLGGPDLIAFKDSTSSKEAEASGSKLKDNNFYDKQSHQLQGIHFAKRPDWMCRPRSGCKPCQKSELYNPYCQPYGNRILIECRKIEATKPPERKPLDGTNVQPPPPPPSTSNDITPGKDAKPVDDTGAKGALDEMLAHPIPVDKDNPILPKPFIPIVEDKFAHIMEETGAMGALNGRSIDDLQQFGDIFLESRSEDLMNVELRPRDELFVSGHVYKGYQICGRDQAREARDYAEFLGVNLILALVGIYILLNRQRFLAGEHRSMLARRIGRT